MDELEALACVRGVDEEDLARALVLVEGGVGAVDQGGVVLLLPGEGLEVLEEPGLGRAGEAGEAGRCGLGGGGAAVVHDALLEREGGTDEDELGAVRPAPGDEGLVVAGDVEDVGVELGLLDDLPPHGQMIFMLENHHKKQAVVCFGGASDLLVGEDAEPVAVAQAVGRPLGLAVSAGRGGVLKGGADRGGPECVMVLITSPMLKLAYEQSQSRFRGVFADEDGKGFSLPFDRCNKEFMVTVREHERGLYATLPCKLVDKNPGMAHADGTKGLFIFDRGMPSLEMTVKQDTYFLVLGPPNSIDTVNLLARVMNVLATLHNGGFILVE